MNRPDYVPERAVTGVEYGSADVAYSGEILRTTVGSGVHGIAIAGTDDHDEMGVFVEPASMVMGLRKPQDHYTWRTQPEGARSGPGDTDRVLYSLRRYLQLAIKGNPTALLPLFAPASDVIVETELGRQLRNLRHSFLSQEAAERFLGYMHGQHERMLGRGRRSAVPNRPELVERYGFDVKYASHALRLAMQGRELVLNGNLTLPMPLAQRGEVLAVKMGQVPLAEVDARITGLEREVRALLAADLSALPPKPDTDLIGAWSEYAHLQHWGVA